MIEGTSISAEWQQRSNRAARDSPLRAPKTVRYHSLAPLCLLPYFSSMRFRHKHPLHSTANQIVASTMMVEMKKTRMSRMKPNFLAKSLSIRDPPSRGSHLGEKFRNHRYYY